MIIALFLIGGTALIIAIGLACATKAPIGYEDDSGFHYGYSERNVRSVFSESFSPVSLKSPTPEAEKGVVSAPFRIHWAKPALGLAALLMTLLVLLPELMEEDKKSPLANQHVPLKSTELIPKSSPIATPVMSGQSSKFGQLLCQRFDRVE
jgi:hypothetical protein